MRSAALGVVTEKGKNVNLKVGQLVSGTFGWTEYAVVREKDATPIEYVADFFISLLTY